MLKDPEEIRKFFDKLKSDVYQRYLGQLEENRMYYYGNYEGKIIPEQWEGRLEALIPPTASHAVDEAADHILTVPRVKVPRKPVDGQETQAEEIAEKKRKFLNSWWHMVTITNDPLGKGKKLLLLDGKIAVKKTIKWDLVPSKPGADKRERERYREAIKRLGRSDFLWDLELLTNDVVFEDPNNPHDPAYVFLSYEVRVGRAKEMFENASGDWVKTHDIEKVRYLEYWSRPERDADGEVEPGLYLQWIEDELVHRAENPYPYVPIAVEDAGFGLLTSDFNPQDRYVGLIQRMYPIFEAEATQMSAWQAVTKMTAFPMAVTRNFPEDKNLVVGPAEVVNLEGDEGQPGSQSLDLVRWPEMPVGVIQLVQKTTEIANSVLKTGILGGIPQSGIETATEADQNVRNASTKLTGPVSALERLATKINKWILMDIELLEAPVTVFGAAPGSPSEITLSPSEVGGYYTTHVEMRTSDQDALNQINARFWAELYRVIPFLSLYTTMEKMGMEDPQREMLQRAAEDVFLSPEFATIRKFTAAQSFGELAQMVNQMQSPGGQGPQGAPGANSADALVEQETLGSPLEARIIDDAYSDRDIMQSPSEYR